MSQSRSEQRWNLGLLGALAIGGALAFCGDYALAQMRGDGTPRSNDIANLFLLNPNGKLQFSNTIGDKKVEAFSQAIPQQNKAPDCAFCPPASICCP